MDASRLDRLSRVLATAPTRRTALSALAALLGHVVGTPDKAEAKPHVCRPLGSHCFPNRGVRCCRGECRGGRCRCPRGQRRCGNRCLQHGRRCRPARKRCRPNQKRCRGRCIGKNACCGGCPKGHVCRRGSCCIRPTGAALQAALNAGGPSTIRLCPNTTYRGTFTIARPVTVIGAGATSSILDGEGAGSVVVITDAVSETVHLHGLGIINGEAITPGIEHGGGIRADGPLTVTRCRVTNNFGRYSGGGIATTSTLTLVDTVVANNESRNRGGGIHAEGSGAHVTLRGNSRVEDNRNIDTSGGGGISMRFGAAVTLRDRSVVRRNESVFGGGIEVLSGCITILRDDSRIEGNTGRLRGGGVHVDSGGQLVLRERSRITGNRALEGPTAGGGIYAWAGSTVDLPDAAMVTANTPDQCEPGLPTGDGGTCS